MNILTKEAARSRVHWIIIVNQTSSGGLATASGHSQRSSLIINSSREYLTPTNKQKPPQLDVTIGLECHYRTNNPFDQVLDGTPTASKKDRLRGLECHYRASHRHFRHKRIPIIFPRLFCIMKK